MQNLFSRQLINEMQAHALAEFPKIAVGFISGWTFHKLPSIEVGETNKESTWQMIYESELLNDKRRKRFLRFIVFSRPCMVNFPNDREMREQLISGAPWMYIHTDGVDCMDPIVWGKGAPYWPLIGRPFRHAITDCYSLIRDYYWLEHKIFLEEFPRDWFWWESEYRADYLGEPKDLYTENFQSQGFEPFSDMNDLRPGDSLLMKLNSPSVNHAVIYVGDGKILHHVSSAMPVDYKRVSKYEDMHPWTKRYEAIPVRHKNFR